MLIFQLQRNTPNEYFLFDSPFLPLPSPTFLLSLPDTKLFFKINIPSFHYHYTSFIYAGQARSRLEETYGLWTPMPCCHMHLFISVLCSILKAICFFLGSLWIGNLLRGPPCSNRSLFNSRLPCFCHLFLVLAYLSVVIPFHP